MGGIELLGLAAGAMTTAAFVPQALRTWRTGSARDFSLPMLLLFCTGLSLWLVYGVLIASASVVAANAITLPLAAYILWVKVTGRE
ncbi:MAG: SemiSWEET transporter [Acetobacteraceae bacterium]|nr:SemiSWEET transporter [Acetobacteraceae bacterium]MCX7684883.1 SemiSWEET transporter [Acetobacteraceae bacterium]MDW8397933.1 SemiSWEET transporter [Acetobacteraceae bacterium]